MAERKYTVTFLEEGYEAEPCWVDDFCVLLKQQHPMTFERFAYDEAKIHPLTPNRSLSKQHFWIFMRSLDIAASVCPWISVKKYNLVRARWEVHWCSISFGHDVYSTVLHFKCSWFMHNTWIFIRSLNKKRIRKKVTSSYSDILVCYLWQLLKLYTFEITVIHSERQTAIIDEPRDDRFIVTISSTTTLRLSQIKS